MSRVVQLESHAWPRFGLDMKEFCFRCSLTHGRRWPPV